jgi:hypothetical protein
MLAIKLNKKDEALVLSELNANPVLRTLPFLKTSFEEVI